MSPLVIISDLIIITSLRRINFIVVPSTPFVFRALFFPIWPSTFHDTHYNAILFILASTTDAAVQVDLDEILGDGDSSSSGVDTSSMTEKADSEVCHIGCAEKGACATQSRPFDCSIESRNFHPKKTTKQNCVAIRLASVSLPSPVLDRRTII